MILTLRVIPKPFFFFFFLNGSLLLCGVCLHSMSFSFKEAGSGFWRPLSFFPFVHGQECTHWLTGKLFFFFFFFLYNSVYMSICKMQMVVDWPVPNLRQRHFVI